MPTLTVKPRTFVLSAPEEASMYLSREVAEGQQNQGVNEIVAWSLRFPAGTSPTPLSVSVENITSGSPTDVTATTTSGSPSASGDAISNIWLFNLTLYNLYRVAVRCLAGNGNVLEPYFVVMGDY